MKDNHKYSNFLGEMFPNQFRTIPSIIIWTLVFIFDVIVVFWVAHMLEFPILDAAGSKLTLILYLGISFALFCVESFLYNLIKQ